jgi:hypothetical protein
MIWNLSCRKTRHRLALSAGSDLEELLPAQTQRHLAVCPRCRETWQGLRHSQQVLERLSVARMEDEGAVVSEAGAERAQGSERRSIWPGVAQYLGVIDEQAAAPNWRGWLPSGALAAACLAVVLVTIPDPQFGVKMAENPRPLVIYPQPASVGTPGGFHRFQGPVSDRDRDLPEIGGDSSVQFLPGDDEPRSF